MYDETDAKGRLRKEGTETDFDSKDKKPNKSGVNKLQEFWETSSSSSLQQSSSTGGRRWGAKPVAGELL